LYRGQSTMYYAVLVKQAIQTVGSVIRAESSSSLYCKGDNANL